MRMMTLLTALLFTAFTVSGEKSVDLRLHAVSFDAVDGAMYVDVQLRYDQSGQFVLGGQNFRLFYNSESLVLDAESSTSRLPKKLYSALNIVENHEGINADEVNQVSFDDDMGYVNLSIDLKANEQGGIVMRRSDEWIAVARLKFNIKEARDDYQIVWGRLGKTDKYATAFVEVSEWIEPYNIRTADVSYFEDLEMINERKIDEDVIQQVKIGPNPASEFLNVNFSNPAAQNGTILIRDIAGRTVSKKNYERGMQNVRMDLSNLSAAQYLMDVISEDNAPIYREKIILTNSY